LSPKPSLFGTIFVESSPDALLEFARLCKSNIRKYGSVWARLRVISAIQGSAGSNPAARTRLGSAADPGRSTPQGGAFGSGRRSRRRLWGCWCRGRRSRRRPAFQKIIVFRRDDAAADDQNVVGTFALQRLDQRRDEGLVTGGVVETPPM
jgi:hypothetical protein